ncbi:hypothetical protein AES38_00605 [Clavibacter capsici]|nr:hypothetical protein AES38_00605 [Clavibacter capsici]
MQTKGFAGRLVIARELASELEPLASVMSNDSADFASDIALIDAMLKNIFARSDDEDPETITNFLDKVEEMLEAAEGGGEGMMQMRAGVSKIRGLSRDLRPVADALDRSLGEVITGIRVMLDWRTPMAEVRASLLTRDLA